MKKFFVLLLSALLLAAMTSCHMSNEAEKGKAENSYFQQCMVERTSYDTFEEVLSQATDVIKGKCVDVVEVDSATEYEFAVETRYRGEDTGENVFVYMPHYFSEASKVSYQK